MKQLLRYSFTFLLILSCLIVIPACRLKGALSTENTTTEITTTTTTVTTTTTTSTTTSTTTAPTTTTTTATTTAKPTAGNDGTATTVPDATVKVSFPDTLFIGDSRSVGLKEYGKLSDATFFCSVGLNAYKVTKEVVDVSGFGKVTLEQLLGKKQFKQVYIMLGINELGYGLETTTQKYRDLIAVIHAKQPDAKIVINSTLHVTKACNDITTGNKAIFTNKRVNDFNNLIAALADNQTIFYLDLNPAFDDAGGHLDKQYAAGDGIHIKAKGYLVWRDYLDKHRFA